MRRISKSGTGLTVTAFLLTTSVLSADLIRLRSGGELRGMIDRDRKAEDGSVQVTTLSGAKVIVAKEDIQFVTRRSLALERYETAARRADRTVESQWEMAEWCRKKGMMDERKTHLAIIVELDPEHEQAHYALGHTKHKGEWVSRDDLMTSQGYVKHKGRWVTQQELDLIQKTQAQLEAEQAWHKKIRLWTGWLAGRNQQRAAEGLASLQAISDPNAVTPLVRILQKHDNRNMRMLFVNALKNIGGETTIKPLVWQMLYDNDPDLRYAALSAVDSEFHTIAAGLLTAGLKSDFNEVILRAARALQNIGNEESIQPLIGSLVTTHKYRVFIETRTNEYGFATNGSFAGGGVTLPPEIEGLLRTGQLPNGVKINNPRRPPTRKTPVVFSHKHYNEPVLAALQKLTGENYGYDQRTWRLWVSSKANE